MYYSPLRYPGGKGKILSFMKALVECNNLQDSEYVEPYVGGAAVALGLLLEGYVSRIHINDLDKAIHSFWHSILNDTENFSRKIHNTEITVDEWKKQKQIYTLEESSSFELGFAAFFLNRCNHSGVLKGGIIGGFGQHGEWKIDARFNKQDLINRIEKIAEYSSRIELYNKDTFDLLTENKKQFEKAIIYLDPPYFQKGHQLYKNHYKAFDHEEIANLVRELKGHWVISYDNVVEIKNLYDFAELREFNISYSVGTKREGAEIMFFSDKLIIPNRAIC